MTIFSAINSLKVWGIKGAIDYLRRWPTLRRLRLSDRSHGRKPSRGLTLIGPFSSHNGNSQTMRNFARMLKATNIPLQTFDTNDKPTIPKSDYVDLITPRAEFDLGRYDHVIELFTSHAPRDASRLHALLAFWEFESGFDFAFPDSMLSQLPLIAMSNFNEHYFRSLAVNGKRVFKIRHPLILDRSGITPSETIRSRYNIPSNSFMVFFNFDYGSSYYRKNPEAVLKAFAHAFTSNDNATLLLKTSNAKKHPVTASRLKSLAKELSLGPDRLLIVEGAVPQCDMSGFFQACDVYISLHRGEGFGIGMAEAMACGKPVIATGYSANTEFCKKETSVLVPFRFVIPGCGEIDNPAYGKVTSWAEPDIDFAAAALVKCRTDHEFAQKLGAAGAAFIQDYFSSENFKKDVEVFLDAPPSGNA